MRLVPAGQFTMGNSADTAYVECVYGGGTCGRGWFNSEEPAHTVSLDTFYMDRYEVTNALYEACVSSGVCDPPHEASSSTHSSYYGNPQYDNYPVINVDWNQAKTYCGTWRGARLPTESEWEKAARGTDGRTYPWGKGLGCGNANYSLGKGDGRCVGDTTEVGSYASGVSPYGLYDMAGNVWEWVADWYSETYYQSSPFENPLGPSSGGYRVLRGGSWQSFSYSVRTAYRSRNVPPDDWFNYIGFRCARSLP